MNPFRYAAPDTLDEAIRLLRGATTAEPIAGGQDLLTQMKSAIATPELLVSLSRIAALHAIDDPARGGGFAIGSQVTLERIATHPAIATRFTALAQAAASVATPQIRTLGTLGGNLCQRPRCWYFRCEDVSCLRKGGPTCLAQDGENRYHAIFENSRCAIVHPSDLAPALLAFDATVAIDGKGGSRSIPIASLFVKPGEHIDRETSLERGDLITAVQIPRWPEATRSCYVKVREKDSFDFALVSAAVVLATAAGKVTRAGIALGGVAPIPWRVPAAQDALVGKDVDEGLAASAARAALTGATPLAQNGYKVHLATGVLTRAILMAAGLDDGRHGAARGPKPPDHTLPDGSETRHEKGRDQ